MVINALNSGADVFMADFEDATSPTWDNLVQGQINVRDAVRREISYDDPGTGKAYRLGEKLATLIVRPRGLHLPERHVEVDGRPMHGSLFDFGLAFFHNAAELLERGSGPYYYLPKFESYREAALWNEVFVASQDALGVPRGRVRYGAHRDAPGCIRDGRDPVRAARARSWPQLRPLGLHLQPHQDSAGPSKATFPDRSQVAMTQPFMRAYTQLAIKTLTIAAPSRWVACRPSFQRATLT